jgi:hypothetical protein
LQPLRGVRLIIVVRRTISLIKDIQKVQNPFPFRVAEKNSIYYPLRKRRLDCGRTLLALKSRIWDDRDSTQFNGFKLARVWNLIGGKTTMEYCPIVNSVLSMLLFGRKSGDLGKLSRRVPPGGIQDL